MAVAWRKYGLKALEKTAKESPAAFCKLYALIMPKEMKVEHTNERYPIPHMFCPRLDWTRLPTTWDKSYASA